VINRCGRLAGKVSTDPKLNRKAAELRTHLAESNKMEPAKRIGETTGGTLLVVFGVLATGACFQHLYTSFMEDRWGILIAGLIFLPISIIHGFGIWLGFWH
jgi:hypothetical protein